MVRPPAEPAGAMSGVLHALNEASFDPTDEDCVLYHAGFLGWGRTFLVESPKAAERVRRDRLGWFRAFVWFWAVYAAVPFVLPGEYGVFLIVFLSVALFFLGKVGPEGLAESPKPITPGRQVKKLTGLVSYRRTP